MRSVICYEVVILALIHEILFHHTIFTIRDVTQTARQKLLICFHIHMRHSRIVLVCVNIAFRGGVKVIPLMNTRMQLSEINQLKYLAIYYMIYIV